MEMSVHYRKDMQHNHIAAKNDMTGSFNQSAGNDNTPEMF